MTFDKFGQSRIAKYLEKSGILAKLMFVTLSHFSNRTYPGDYRQVLECGFGIYLTKASSEHSLSIRLMRISSFSRKITVNMAESGFKVGASWLSCQRPKNKTSLGKLIETSGLRQSHNNLEKIKEIISFRCFLFPSKFRICDTLI